MKRIEIAAIALLPLLFSVSHTAYAGLDARSANTTHETPVSVVKIRSIDDLDALKGLSRPENLKFGDTEVRGAAIEALSNGGHILAMRKPLDIASMRGGKPDAMIFVPMSNKAGAQAVYLAGVGPRDILDSSGTMTKKVTMTEEMKRLIRSRDTKALDQLYRLVYDRATPEWMK